MVVMASGKINRLQADHIPSQGRRTRGRALFPAATGDRVVEVTRVYSEQVGGKSGAGTAEAGEEPGVVDEQQEPEAEDALSVGQLDLLG